MENERVLDTIGSSLLDEQNLRSTACGDMIATPEIINDVSASLEVSKKIVRYQGNDEKIYYGIIEGERVFQLEVNLLK